MKYFSLEHEYQKTIVGPYPQSEGMADYYNYNKENSVWNLWYGDTSMLPDLNAIKLVKGAKLTDMLSVTVITPMGGKVISERFKELLQEFNLPKHYFFSAQIVDHRQQPISNHQYYLFRVVEYQNQYINFDRSEFLVHSLGSGPIGSIDIRCDKDLELSSEELGLGVGEVVKPKFISLLPEGNKDLFSFRRFSPGLFISETLKKAIESRDLTGIRFENADYIVQSKKERKH